MGKTARNALKGYTYQNYIMTLFLAKMDTERNITKIESEALGTEQFDDIYIETIDGAIYRVQAKNYPGAALKDITITEHIVTIRGNSNEYNPTDNNVLIVNTNQIITDTNFMGMPAIIKNNIIIIPLTEDEVANILDKMYQREDRELQIIQKAYEFTCSEKFEITIDDLPQLIAFSTNLLKQTILLRTVPDSVEKGINYIVGKPGVGKSHYVEELKAKYTDAIIYRFWIDPQDSQLRRRLQFDIFVNEIGLLAFKSPRSFSQDELIAKIATDDRILIIDGLDHVENYNPKDLHRFIDFINRLGKAKTRVVVLSRPMKAELAWEKTELINWNFAETRMYLAASYDISEYGIQKKLFEITNGYPIVTYFLAEHFNKYGELNFDTPIEDLNLYYDNLLNDVNTKSALCIFATNNSFFTYKELESFVSDPEMFDILSQSISGYPYLFEIVQNRISLVHDSFNTYLRKILSSFSKRLELVNSIVQGSLKSKNIEYMARLSSFDFDESFLDELLILYSEFSVYKELLSHTLDFNSITSFYSQLQHILETKEGVLDSYQYYSFALIFQTATRNDLVGYDGLMYQELLYMYKHGGIENQIFSSGIMWNLYLACIHRGDLTRKFMADTIYGEYQLDSLYESLEKETTFFNCLGEPFACENIEAQLSSKELDSLEKSEILQEYLVSIWIHGKKTEAFNDDFRTFVETGNSASLSKSLKKYGLDTYWIDSAVWGARKRLHELGFFGNDNWYRTESLMQLIMDSAPNGSFDVAPAAQSFLRLANHENRTVDVTSINYVWTMYAQRKDYSVHTIDKALILFEKQGLIDENSSIEIINKLINQSEKGIRLLLTSYINAKGNECVKRLIAAGRFQDSNFNVDIFDLDAVNINCFPRILINMRISDMLRYCNHSMTVEADCINNVLESNYSTYVLNILKKYGICVYGSTPEHIRQKLADAGIKYLGISTQVPTAYHPFDGGYIHEADFEYIREKCLPAEECAKYADGWYSCLPFVELFELFDPDELSRNYLHILHQAMFARVADKEYIGNWYNLIGNIPHFLSICKADVDWRILFEIFKCFLDVSLIYYPDSLKR